MFCACDWLEETFFLTYSQGERIVLPRDHAKRRSLCTCCVAGSTDISWPLKLLLLTPPTSIDPLGPKGSSSVPVDGVRYVPRVAGNRQSQSTNKTVATSTCLYLIPSFLLAMYGQLLLAQVIPWGQCNSKTAEAFYGSRSPVPSKVQLFCTSRRLAYWLGIAPWLQQESWDKKLYYSTMIISITKLMCTITLSNSSEKRETLARGSVVDLFPFLGEILHNARWPVANVVCLTDQCNYLLLWAR